MQGKSCHSRAVCSEHYLIQCTETAALIAMWVIPIRSIDLAILTSAFGVRQEVIACQSSMRLAVIVVVLAPPVLLLLGSDDAGLC